MWPLLYSCGCANSKNEELLVVWLHLAMGRCRNEASNKLLVNIKNSTSSATVITWASATVNSHILRMATVVNSIWVSWAGGQPWFCTNAIDIVQPDCSTCRPKPTKQKLFHWTRHNTATYFSSFPWKRKLTSVWGYTFIEQWTSCEHLYVQIVLAV